MPNLGTTATLIFDVRADFEVVRSQTSVAFRRIALQFLVVFLEANFIHVRLGGFALQMLGIFTVTFPSPGLSDRQSSKSDRFL